MIPKTHTSLRSHIGSNISQAASKALVQASLSAVPFMEIDKDLENELQEMILDGLLAEVKIKPAHVADDPQDTMSDVLLAKDEMKPPPDASKKEIRRTRSRSRTPPGFLKETFGEHLTPRSLRRFEAQQKRERDVYRRTNTQPFGL